jgi:hypothetical protein
MLLRFRGWPALAVLAFLARSATPQDEVKWTQAELERLSREIMADLERLRGEVFQRPVAVRVCSKPELIEYIKKREAKHTPPERQAADEWIAKALGVVPPDMDLRARTYALLETQVAGFYDPDTDSFSLMETLPVPLTKITLAHELDHALDDQLFDIDGTLERLGDDSDAAYAYHAVIEGAGTAVMTQWMLQAKEALDLGSLSEKQQKELTALSGAPDWLWKPLMASYTTGAAFLARSSSWASGASAPLASADVRAAFTSPPRSTEQVLHPDKYWKPEQREEPRRVAVEAVKLPSGWSVLRSDVLGELLIGIVTTPPEERDHADFSNPMALLGVRFTHEISTGWGGDRLVLVGKDEARVLRWVSVWDTPRDAGEFFGAMRQRLPELEAAARALAGTSEDAGAELEYGSEGEVVLLVRAGASRADVKRIERGLAWTIEAR